MCVVTLTLTDPDTIVYPILKQLLCSDSYLSVLLGGLDHVHVHIIHQVGHLWHVLDDLVRLSWSISLSTRKKNQKCISKIKIVLNPQCCVDGMIMKKYISLVSSCSFWHQLVNYWSESKCSGKLQFACLPQPTRYLKANFSVASSSTLSSRTIKRSRGCRVCNLIKLVCRQSPTA